jgi:hypothetical protein
MGFITLPPAPQGVEKVTAIAWVTWFTLLQKGLTSNTPMQMPVYTLATLPLASGSTGKYIEVSDATGGAKLCRSDGVHWLLVNTTTIVS